MEMFDEDYAALADAALMARLDAHLNALGAPTISELEAAFEAFEFAVTLHGCWPTPDEVWMWEIDCCDEE